MADLRDLIYYGDVGMHRHDLILNQNKTNSSGGHSHVFVVEADFETAMGTLYEGRILFADYDGAHEHGLGAKKTSGGGAHSHAVSWRGINWGTSEGDAHEHELAVQSTARDGVHGHTLEIGGATLKALMPSDFHAMMREVLAKGDVAAPEIVRNNGALEVQAGGKTLSKHETREGAEKAAELHHFVMKCGLSPEAIDFEGIAWLAKSVDLLVEKEVSKTVTGGGLLGKMCQLLKDDGGRY